MKKHLPVVVTLILGIALGGGCMFFLLQRMNPPPPAGPGGSVRDKAKEDGDADGDSTLDGRFAVTSGAAPGYIEDKACAACHQELFDAYQQVGMAQSFARPRAEILSEDFENSHFVHQASKRHYEMLRIGDGLIFRRYQLDDAGQPINEFERRVDWILGSGKHARNYLYQTEVGEMYQLPVAWYPQEQRWDMAPNFEAPEHEGVHHAITRECMFCHNAYPNVPEGSDAYSNANTFPRTLPQGIGCQRCHGPGAEHVRVASSDKASAERKRETIVNPAKLSPQLRDDVCNQCHFQPSSALAGMRQFGRADYSYRPGNPLAEYLIDLDVVEEGKQSSERFEINHHSYRLSQSRCFLESPETMSCLTCHDAHHTVPEADRAKHYAAACAKCHKADDCTLEAPVGGHPPGLDAQDCASCHMPKRRTQDAVHVVMTDHLIRKTPLDGSQLAAIQASRPKLKELVLSLPGAKQGDDAYEMVHASALLRLSGYALAEPANKLENVLAALDPPAVDPFMDLTMAQLKQRRFAAAQHTADQILERIPDQPLALEWQGTALLSLRQGDVAVEHLQRALAISPNRAEAHYNLGLLLLGQDNAKEASKRFERALELRPNMVLAAYYRGVVMERMERAEDAVRAYEQALQIEPSFGRAYLNLGQLLLTLDRRDDARRYLRHGIQVATNAEPLIELFQKAEFADVTPILSESVTGAELPPAAAILVAVPIPDFDRLEPSVATQIKQFLAAFARLSSEPSVAAAQLAEGYGMLGQLYQAYEFNEAAERCYINAIRLTPQDDRSYHLLGALYQQVGQLAAAQAYLKVALKLKPENVAAAVRLGTINLQLNEPAKAREYFQDALQKDPESAAAHNGLGDVALAEEKYAEAVTHFEAALQRAPDANRVHYSLGMAYRGLGETDKAQAELEQRGPVGIRPADPLVDALPQLLQGERVHMIRGQLAYSAGRFTEAAEAYAQALEANAESVSALTNYGAALTKIGQLDDAAVQLRKALEIDPKNVTAHFNLAAVSAKLGEFDSAIEHYDAVLETAPLDRTVRRSRAGVLRQASRSDEALQALEELLDEQADDELTMIDLSDLLVERREYGRAIEMLSAALERFPERGLTSSTLAKLLATCPDLSLRNGVKAVQLANQVAQAQQTPQHLETLALSLAEAGRCEEAARIQKELVALAVKLGNEEMASRLASELVRYEAGSPCRPASESAASLPPAIVPVPDPLPKQEDEKSNGAKPDAEAEKMPPTPEND
ncbi:MAG: tetratricopeptide repeat protein [Planctomycetota bacterium]|nr:tetratricopeptide repeat protein [Planctomycetota bacterium]